MKPFFCADTANEAWNIAYNALMKHEDLCESRLGVTREILHANFYISNPRERWVLSRVPALNPAFAIAEVFWMLAGENDAFFLNYWNPILPRFAGDGAVYHGAYGYRIRRAFGFDQLERAYSALRNNPDSRQVVIQIWDSRIDFPGVNGVPVNPDIPCNICSMPKVRAGKLEWMQIMRSNDIYRGTPHNIIQFSTLQEVLAGWLDVELGGYHQISDSLHLYERNVEEVSNDNNLVIPSNEDSLAISKNDFEYHMKLMMEYFRVLSGENLNMRAFNRIINMEKLTRGYKNLLLIAAADSARRRGWVDEMRDAASCCVNPLLRLAFSRWEERYPVLVR